MVADTKFQTEPADKNDTISLVTFEALVSAKGVPLELSKGENHLFVVLPARCCDHHATRAVPRMSSPGEEQDAGLVATIKFATAEHIISVAGLKFQIPGQQLDALKAELPVANDLHLTYGQIVALGGDFFGNPDRPICLRGDAEGQIAQFEENFRLLQSSAAEVVKILEIAERYEFRPIAERVSQHEPPSGAYAAIPWTEGVMMNDEDQEFDRATGGGGPGSAIFGRYTLLAATNFDHFGKDAEKSYLAGHTLALRTAIEARQIQDSTKSVDKLKLAYAINAFADHFLTDLFAAGHIRTPRRKLYDSAWSSLTELAAGYCAKAMHDEDNKFGLWVKNNRGDKWVAYGDSRYRDPVNAANRAVMKAAIQVSMNEVFDAYNTSSLVTCKVLDYLPKPIEDVDQASRDDNWAPLFWCNSVDQKIYRRKDLNDIADRTREKQGLLSGWGITTTAKILSERAGPYMPPQEYTNANCSYPPPDEGGPSGEIGWPPQPVTVIGTKRMQHGVEGLPRALKPEDWRIDGTPG